MVQIHRHGTVTRATADELQIGQLVATHGPSMRFAVGRDGAVRIFGTEGLAMCYRSAGRKLAVVQGLTRLRVVALGAIDVVPAVVADLVTLAPQPSRRA